MTTPLDPAKLAALFDTATAADEREPLPAGEYTADVESGELGESRNGTPCYKITFRVVGGDYDSRPFWLDCYLTPDAIGYAKRDLAKLGITDFDALNEPLPAGIRCKVKLTLRTYQGERFNRVQSFSVIETDAANANPFPPEQAGG